MIGTLVNAAAIAVGSLIGVFFNRHIPERVKDILFQALGLVTILIGLSMAMKTANILILIFSMILGGVIGEVLHIEKKLDDFGTWLKSRVKSKDSNFIEGFVTASLIFCVGAMAIMGSIEEGISGDRTILYTKSLLDGTAAVAFSSALGIGVIFSAIPIVLYQGGLTLLAGQIKAYLSQAAITEMSAAGGLLIFGIGLTILEIKKIKVGNLLPAIAVAAVLATFFA